MAKPEKHEPLDHALRMYEVIRYLPGEEQKSALTILNSLLAADEVKKLRDGVEAKKRARDEKYPSLAEAEKLQ